MIKKQLEKLEDPKRPLLGPNIWILKLSGLIESEKIWIRLYYYIFYFLATLFIISQWIEVYYIQDNLNLVLNNVKVSCLSLVANNKAMSFFFGQKKWLQLFEYVTEADLEERAAKDPYQRNIVKSYTKYCRRVNYVYWAIAYMTVMSLAFNPLMLYIVTPNYVEKLKEKSIPFPHIISAWVPFDKETAPGCWIIVVWQLMLCFYGAALLASFDGSMLAIMKFFENKLQLLQFRCSSILDTKGEIINDDEFLARVKDCHRIHVMLRKLVVMFYLIYNKYLEIYYLLPILNFS